MLDTLLETIGTLGILISLAAKFRKPSADAKACDAAGRDRLHATVLAFPSGSLPPPSATGPAMAVGEEPSSSDGVAKR
jgi:hypothetical protein